MTALLSLQYFFTYKVFALKAVFLYQRIADVQTCPCYFFVTQLLFLQA